MDWYDPEKKNKDVFEKTLLYSCAGGLNYLPNPYQPTAVQSKPFSITVSSISGVNEY